jgi:hypothetical protein
MEDAPRQLESATSPALDMCVAADPTMLAEEVRLDWQISPERKCAYFTALDRVVENIDQITDPGQRGVIAVSCVRVLLIEQSHALRDLHHIERLRHEAGILDKPNHCIAVEAVVLERPVPEFMQTMRKQLPERIAS